MFLSGFQAGADYRVITLLFADGVLNWLQNIIAFSVLSLVTPLTYAVASASKRIFVIAVSLFILGNPVTWMNIFGMMLAVLGVLVYNRVGIWFAGGLNHITLLTNGYSAHQAKHLSRQKSILPTISASSSSNGGSNWPKYTKMSSNPDADPYSPTYRNGRPNGGIGGTGGNLLLNGSSPNTTSSSSRLLFV